MQTTEQNMYSASKTGLESDILGVDKKSSSSDKEVEEKMIIWSCDMNTPSWKQIYNTIYRKLFRKKFTETIVTRRRPKVVN